MKRRYEQPQKRGKRKLRKDKGFYIAILCFIFGLGLLMYPSISNWVNERNGSKVISTYNEAVSNLDKEQFEFEWNEAIKHNEFLADRGFLAAGYDMEMADDLETYNSLLNVGKDGVMGSIRVPKLDLAIPIYHTTSDAVLQRAVGHFVGSSLPVGGKSSHSILSGHRGLPSAELFSNLDQMKKGDLFYIDVLNQTLAYKVDKIKTIDPDNKKDLDIVEGKDYVTLLTCTPYGVNTHRLLVRGHRVPYEKKQEKKEIQKGKSLLQFALMKRVLLLVGSFIIALIFAIRLGIFLADKHHR